MTKTGSWCLRDTRPRGRDGCVSNEPGSQVTDSIKEGETIKSSPRSDDQGRIPWGEDVSSRWRRERLFQEPQRQKQEGAEMHSVFIEDTEEPHHHPRLQQLCTAQLRGRPVTQTVTWMVRSRVMQYGGWIESPWEERGRRSEESWEISLSFHLLPQPSIRNSSVTLVEQLLSTWDFTVSYHSCLLYKQGLLRTISNNI